MNATVSLLRPAASNPATRPALTDALRASVGAKAGTLTITASNDFPDDTIVINLTGTGTQSVVNVPANLARYAALLAQLRGISIDEVVETTGRNVCEVLGGWQPG